MSDEISSNKIKELSQQVLHFSRDCLMVNLRFMDAALSRLTLESRESMSDVFATDGVRISYNSRLLLKAYQDERTAPTRDYLHTVFHCVFGHIFVPELVTESACITNETEGKNESKKITKCAEVTFNQQHSCKEGIAGGSGETFAGHEKNLNVTSLDGRRRIWDLACDIAVEYAITGLGQSTLTCQRQQRQEKVFANLASKLGLIAAEKIYKYYMKNPLPQDELVGLEKMFHVDGHAGWKVAGKEKNGGILTGAAGTNTKVDGTNADASDVKTSIAQDPADAKLKDEWLAVSRRMQIDMETFARRQAGKAGAMMESLRETNRETSDYAAFLKTFAIKGDGMKLNPDEFDMITYSYGMRMSGGKVPLIEPTEYKDSMRVRDFVLAIETADMDVEKIKRFVRNTWDILHDSENFFSKVRLHILDGGETLISDAEALNKYLRNFNGPAKDCIIEIESDGGKAAADAVRIEGADYRIGASGSVAASGMARGVDSRAVFNRVAEMRRQNKFRNIRGLLLFTDTQVIYPANMPDFKTVFIFANDDYSVPQVPAWGIRQVLEADGI